MTDKQGTVYRKNYKQSSHFIDSVDLCFDLFDDSAIVTNVMQIRALGKKQPLVLQGEALELLSVTMDGKLLDAKRYSVTENSLTLSKCPESFTLCIKTRIKPQENTKLMGLYRSNDLFCTQCEAEGFRRMTYFLDRPDVLSIYTTKLIADKKRYPVLLSNGNLMAAEDLADGRHFAVWHDPFKKPSYLFALVAGDLASVEDTFTTASGREVALKVFVDHGFEDKCAHAMNALKNAMRWDEDVYGREYDLDIFMLVAVHDFNMGAMENKGLNIFNAKCVLASPLTATDSDFASIEGIVAHEYFHNWTGNRVTCRDWFQLSLKEGLTVFRDQEFSRDMNSPDVGRIQDVRLLRASQFPEDASPMAHPVRPDSYMEINNFYTATVYNKGAEVIRMQHTLLGSTGFRKGTDLYFDRHDGQAVTIDDFVAAMEHANNVDLTQFKRWYSQAGTPEVRVSTKFKDGRLTLRLNQYCAKTPGQDEKLPFHIPLGIALFDEDGERLPIGTELLELKEEKQEFHFEALSSMPVISLLRGFSAPIKLHFEQSDEALALLINCETDGFARFEASYRLAMNHLLKLINAHLSGEPMVLSAALIDTYRQILVDQALDRSLKAEILQVPGFEAIAGELKVVDVDAVFAARDFFVSELALNLSDEWHDCYQSLTGSGVQTVNAQSFAIRQLRSVCLYYLSRQSKYIDLVQQQFSSALNMTDEIAAFNYLLELPGATRLRAIDSFFDKWQGFDLVIDKWFQCQAMSNNKATLGCVKALLSHPSFTINNPNNVRALLGGFSSGNPRIFHALDGLAYTFLADKLLELDKINPQVAARLASPLIRWQRYDTKRQSLMKAELQRVLDAGDLSADLYEVISKSLS